MDPHMLTVILLDIINWENIWQKNYLCKQLTINCSVVSSRRKQLLFGIPSMEDAWNTATGISKEIKHWLEEQNFLWIQCVWNSPSSPQGSTGHKFGTKYIINCKQYVLPKHQYLAITLHGVRTQKIIIHFENLLVTEYINYQWQKSNILGL
jgi:hypothetical protein